MNAQSVLDVARSQIGTVEHPPKSDRTKYGAAFGMDGTLWCAMFVWWVFREAGAESLITKTAFTPTFAKFFQDSGRFDKAPRPGSLVFYDFPGDGINRIQHIGIVESIGSNGAITAIEGNTSPGMAGSQHNGGGVFRRTRNTGIVGFGHPAYDDNHKDGDMSAAEVWNTPIDDAFTPDPVDRMPAAAALMWATAHAAFARRDAAQALAVVQRLETKIDALLARPA